MIKLRQFSLSDLDTILAIAQISFPQPYSANYFETLCRDYPKGFIVAENEGDIVGYAASQPEKEKARIVNISVDPNWRNQGIGTQMTEFLINHFKKKDCKEIFLYTRVKNGISVPFYQALGFKIIQTVERYYQNGDDAYLMKREI